MLWILNIIFSKEIPIDDIWRVITLRTTKTTNRVHTHDAHKFSRNILASASWYFTPLRNPIFQHKQIEHSILKRDQAFYIIIENMDFMFTWKAIIKLVKTTETFNYIIIRTHMVFKAPKINYTSSRRFLIKIYLKSFNFHTWLSKIRKQFC